MRLSEIYFKNYLLLGSGRIVFKDGFNAITGETGAGKSMLLGIINLLKGEKIIWDRFQSQDEVELSGVFIKDDQELIIKRVIIPDKKRSRFFLNDSPVTRETVIREIGDHIEISSQHQQSSLLREDTHIDYYDSLAEILEEREEYEYLYSKYGEMLKELNCKKHALRELMEKMEYLKFKLKELESLNTYPGEEHELEELIYRLENLESLRQAFNDGIMTFYEANNSVYERASSFLREHSAILEKDPEGQKIIPLAENILILSEEIFTKLQELSSMLELDPEELEKKRSRLFKLRETMTKYGFSDTTHLINEIKNLKEKISDLKGEESKIAELEKQLEEHYDILQAKATKLSQKRIGAKEVIEKNIEEELKKLGFPKVSFKVQITKTALGEKGMDLVKFLISTTGTDLLPLKSIASGGELSRLLLAFKTLVARNQPEKILIFDEIDTGIGGKTARIVGKRLQSLSRYNQVIAITHLPQIASLADAHFFVKRNDTKETTIKIKELSGKERIMEIARMLSGDRITESAINHAKTLMEGKGDG